MRYCRLSVVSLPDPGVTECSLLQPGSLTPDHDLRIIAERAGIVYSRGCIDLASTITNSPIGAHPYKSHANISRRPGTHYPASASNRPRPKCITSIRVRGAVRRGHRLETKFLSTSRSYTHDPPSLSHMLVFPSHASHVFVFPRDSIHSRSLSVKINRSPVAYTGCSKYTSSSILI